MKTIENNQKTPVGESASGAIGCAWPWTPTTKEDVINDLMEG
jgi:hypothetical protein